MMIEAEPKIVSFHNISIKQHYSSSVVLQNVLQAPISLIFTPSSSSFKTNPDEVHLAPFQSIAITISMYLENKPNLRMKREDFIMVRLRGEMTPLLKIPIQFSILSSSSPSSRSTSSSPISQKGRPPSRGRDESLAGERAHVMRELHQQNIVKDQRIKELEESIGRVTQKYPDMENIVQSVRREEREKYEERSQKILLLFRQKDEEIESLKQQVADQEKIILTYREIANTNKDLLSDRHFPTSHPSALTSERVIEENKRLNEELIQKNKEIRHLSGLKEVLAEKTEQLEAVVAELQTSKEKAKAMKAELKKKEETIAKLQADVDKVMREKSALNEITQKLQDEVFVYRKNFLEAKHVTNHQKIAMKAGVTEVDYEPQTEGGYATTTPQDFELLRNDPSYATARLYKDIASDYEEKYRQLSLRLQESMNAEKQLREELEAARRKIESEESERQLCQTELVDLKKQMNILADVAANDPPLTQTNPTSSQSPPNANTSDIHDAPPMTSGSVDSAHCWWQYVWHDLQKQRQMLGETKDDDNTAIGIGMRWSGRGSVSGGPGDYDYRLPTNTDDESAAPLIFHAQKLKENLRLQAIEISTLRQELLGVKLRSSEETRSLEHRVKTLEREKQKLVKLLTYQKQEKEIEVTSLKAKVQSLTALRSSSSSSTSPTGSGLALASAQISSLHSEVEAEKISSFHLRLELEEVRQLYETEKQRATALQSDVFQLESKLNAVSVVQTIREVPGISPYHVIQVFSTDFVTMRGEVERARGLVEEAQEEIRRLQRKMTSSTQQLKMMSAATTVGSDDSMTSPPMMENVTSANVSVTPATSGLPPLPPINTESPRKSRTTSVTTSSVRGRGSGSPIRSTSPQRLTQPRSTTKPATTTTSTSASPSRYEQFIHRQPLPRSTSSPLTVPLPDLSEPIHLRVDNETTPKRLLQCLDLAILQNKCLSQEKMIEDLTSELERYQSMTATSAVETIAMTSSPVRQQQLIEEQFLSLSDHVIVSRQEFSELEAVQKKLDLTSFQLEEVRRELEEVRATNAQLEKRQLLSYYDTHWGQRSSVQGGVGGGVQGGGEGGVKLDETLPLLGRGSDYETGDDDSSSLLLKTSDVAPPLATVKDLTWAKKFEALQVEHDRLRLTLQERTSQLKVLTESLDSLQASDADVTSETREIREIETNLFDLAYNPNPPTTTQTTSAPSSQMWVNRALSKRVIELSTDLLSTLSQRTIDQQTLKDRDHVIQALTREKHSLLIQQAKTDKRIVRQQQTIEQLVNEAKQTSAQFIEERAQLTSENQRCLSELSQREVQVQDLFLQLDELRQQLSHREKVDYMDVFQSLLSLNPDVFGLSGPSQQMIGGGGREEQRQSFSQAPPSQSEEEKGLKEMIAALLLHWKETEKKNSVSFFDSNATAASTASSANKSLLAGTTRVTKLLNKSEKDFLQKVSDFVLQLNDHLIATQEKLFHTQQALTQSQEHQNKAENSLSLVIQEMLRQKKRLSVYEKSLKLQHNQVAVKRTLTHDALLKQRIEAERRQKEELYRERNSLKKHLLVSSVELAVVREERARLLLANAQLEAKGSPYYQEKEQHLFNLNDKISTIEKRFLDYVEKEVPRLLSGLPVSEIDRFAFLHPSALDQPWLSAHTQAFASPPTQAPYNSMLGELGAGLGVGKMFDQTSQVSALTQALCLVKVNESKLELQLADVNERLQHYREKYSKVEAVLLKWKDAIEGDLTYATTPPTTASIPTSDNDPTTLVSKTSAQQQQLAELIARLEREVVLSNERESAYLRQIERNEEEKLKLEEDVIEYRNKLQVCQLQRQQLQELLDTSLENDEVVKSKAVQQLNKLRLDLENQHARDVRAVRQWYEEDKAHLLDEIQRLSQTISQHLLPLPDEVEAAPRRRSLSDHSSSGDVILHHSTSEDEHGGEEARGKPLRTPSTTTSTERRHRHRYSSSPHTTPSNTSHTSFEAVKQAEQNHYFQHLLDERETSEQSKGVLRPLPQHPPSSTSSTSSTSSSSKGSGRGGGVITLPVEEERGGDKENHPNLPPPPPPPTSTVEEVSTAEESKKPLPPTTTSISTSATSNMRDVSIDAMSHTSRAVGGVRGGERMTVRPGSDVGTQTSATSSSTTSHNTTNTTKRREDTSPPTSSNDRQSIQEEIIFNRIPFRQRLSQSHHTTSNTTSNTNTERLVLPQIPLPHITLDTTSTTSSSSLHLLDPHNHSNVTASDNNTIRAQIEAINQYNNNNTTSNTSDSQNNNNDNNDPSSSHNTSLVLQLQQENFQRALERERRKSDEFLQEIRELEELLEIQQNYIREQLQGRERGSGGRDRDRERPRDVFEEEVRKEDTSLWPSFSHLLEELLNSLHSLYSRCSEGSDDGNLVRGAIATANRLKLSSATLKPRHPSDFTPSAHPPFTSEAVGGSDTVGVQQSLDALTRRMKLIEQDLMSEEHLLGGRGNEEGGGGVPERYLYLLRDLRYKVNELTDVFHREFSTERDKWLKDKAYYVTQLHEVTSLQEAAKREHQQAVDSMRDYYDKALTQAQDSLQHNTASARREIERLEAVTQQLQQQLQQRQSQQRPPPNTTANTTSTPSEGKVGIGEESVLRMTKEQLEDYHRLQSQLSDTLNALEQLQVRHRLLTVQLNDEKRYMETNFRILKRSYETIIENLENKLLQANTSSDVTSTLNRDSEEVGDSRATSVDLQVQQLQHKYRVKCAELDAVLHLLSSVERGESHVTEPDTTSSDVLGFESEDRATMTSAPPHLSRQRIEEEMKEVRVRGLETEVLTLQEVLAEEKRRCQELQFQLQQIQKNPLNNSTVMTSAPPEPPAGEESALANDMGAKAFVSPTKHTLAVNAEKELIASAETTLRELGRDLLLPLPMTESLQNSENFKYVIKKHNTLRKAAKNDLTKLLQYLKHLPQTSSDVKALRETIQQQREEISRKHKLFTALKETKAQDGHALDLFKQEVKTLEDTVKRLQRQLASRDTMLKELKQRHDALQQQHQQLLIASQQQGLGDLSLMGMEPNAAPNTSSGAAGGGGGGYNLYLLSAPEMRARIKELELERTRQRIRVQSLKDKIHEQEEALTSLGEEKKDLLSFKEKYEKAVLSIQRKDQQCQLYQEKVASLEKQIQQLHHDELQLQAESEKKIRQLQRQMDVALRHQKEYEEESKLLRERLIALNASQLADERERLTSSMQAPPQTSTSSTSNPGRRSGGPGGVMGGVSSSGLTSAVNASTAINRSVHFSDDIRAPEPTNTSNTSSFPLPSVIPPSLSSARDDLHDVIQAVGGTPPSTTTSNTTSTTTANNLLQRLTGLSSILFNDQPLPQPPPSTSSLNISSSTSSASPATFNMSAVPGNVSGGMLDTSSSSSSLFASRTHDTSSATASAIEKRLSALVSAALQSPPRK